jgi:hypothetical protein
MSLKGGGGGGGKKKKSDKDEIDVSLAVPTLQVCE